MTNYHASMIENLMELLAAAGLSGLDEVRPMHINHRVHGADIRTYAELYPSTTAGCLLADADIPEEWRRDWDRAAASGW